MGAPLLRSFPLFSPATIKHTALTLPPTGLSQEADEAEGSGPGVAHMGLSLAVKNMRDTQSFIDFNGTDRFSSLTVNVCNCILYSSATPHQNF